MNATYTLCIVRAAGMHALYGQDGRRYLRCAATVGLLLTRDNSNLRPFVGAVKTVLNPKSQIRAHDFRL